ncbi:hypothetical protein GGQ54_001827 [Naumannella cuiyingiana]|uniref:SDR-like Ig domain-containing protein n=1 Tax=Naumannella cuiyingiana TaxID=1347891 RepID=A0A7Z0D983_9ACTN|nr:hypothetical protein [Naumannella cuiyingiana]
MRAVLAALTTALLALGALVLTSPGTAKADEISGAITQVTTERTSGFDGPLRQWENFDVRANWAVDSTAKAGDTFRLTIPEGGPEIQLFAKDFPLKTADGQTVGNCAATPKEIVCTLTDFVESHDNVEGTLWFTARATKAYDGSETVWTSGDHEVTIQLPGSGGVIGEPWPRPTEPQKAGWQVLENGDLVEYRIAVPASYIQAGTRVTDQYDSRLKFLPDEFNVAEFPEGAWNESGPDWEAGGRSLEPNVDYVLTEGPDNSFTVTFANAGLAGATYLIQYRMDSTGVPVGTEFSNTAGIDDVEVTTRVRKVDAGGDGSGDLPPTPTPSETPTPTPSETPTPTPSETPTPTPSETPTPTPSETPTPTPSETPTPTPSETPTPTPSETPTPTPSETPTPTPSETPTPTPSETPTPTPSETPTPTPSETPCVPPTGPSGSPSQGPGPSESPCVPQPPAPSDTPDTPTGPDTPSSPNTPLADTGGQVGPLAVGAAALAALAGAGLLTRRRRG